MNSNGAPFKLYELEVNDSTDNGAFLLIIGYAQTTRSIINKVTESLTTGLIYNQV